MGFSLAVVDAEYLSFSKALLLGSISKALLSGGGREEALGKGDALLQGLTKSTGQNVAPELENR